MPKFVIERNLPPGTKITPEKLREDALRSLEVLRQQTFGPHGQHRRTLLARLLERHEGLARPLQRPTASGRKHQKTGQRCLGQRHPAILHPLA